MHNEMNEYVVNYFYKQEIGNEFYYILNCRKNTIYLTLIKKLIKNKNCL